MVVVHTFDEYNRGFDISAGFTRHKRQCSVSFFCVFLSYGMTDDSGLRSILVGIYSYYFLVGVAGAVSSKY